MGAHDKRGSSTEEADRNRQHSRDASHHHDRFHRSGEHKHSSKDSKEYRDSTDRSRQESALPLQSVSENVNKGKVYHESNSTAATGSTDSAPRGESSSESRSDRPDPRFDELYTILGTMVAKINSMDKKSEHAMSDSEGDVKESDQEDADNVDPMDNLSGIFASHDASDHPDDRDTDFDFSQAIAEFAGGFSSKEEKGEPLHQDYAAVLNDSLRNKPTDSVLKPLLQAVKIPSNVPNLAVPLTNGDISKAMSNNGKLLDSHLFRTLGMISKAIVPLAQLVADVGEDKAKPTKHYFKSVNASVRILAASVNYLNQTRKEIVRMHVREHALTTLCKWDSPVGSYELFPFDVTKKCDEMGKVRTLGSSSGNQTKRFHRKPNTSGTFKWPPRRFDQKPSSSPYSNQGAYSGKGKGQAGKPFLGKKSQDRHRKRY